MKLRSESSRSQRGLCRLIFHDIQKRQCNREATSAAFLTRNSDVRTVGGANGFHDGQAQPGAARVTRAGLVRPVKSFKNVGQSLSRYPHSIICYLQDSSRSVGVNTYL